MSIGEHIKGLAHIGIPVRDFESAHAFYNALGFEDADKVRFIGDSERRCVFVRRDSVTLELYESVFEGYGGVIDHVALAVDDVDAALAEAVSDKDLELLYGGTSGVENEEWHSRFFTVKTTDGEKIEFNQTTVLDPRCFSK